MLFNLLESRKAKIIFSSVTYLLGSICLYFAIYLAFPFISFGGRGMLTFLPTVLIYFFPLVLSLTFFIYFNMKNVKNKWQTLYYASIIFGSISIVLTIWHILVTSTTIGWGLYGNVTYLFPYDTLLLGLLSCACWVYIFIHSLKTKEYNLVPLTIKEKDEKLNKGPMVAYLSFAAYFLGGFFFFFSLIGDGVLDSDFLFIVIVMLSYLLPLCGAILYALNRYFDLFNKKMLAIIYFASALLIALLIVISVFINPYWIPHSISGLFPLGYAIKMPIGLFILALLLVVSGVTTLIRLLKK